MSAVITVAKLGSDPRRKNVNQIDLDQEVTNEVVAQRTAQATLRPGEYSFEIPVAASARLSGPTETKLSEKLEIRVPLSFVQQAAARAEYKEGLVRELLLFIPFFIVFLVLVVVDSGVEGNYYVSWSVATRLYNRAIPPIDIVTGPNFGRDFSQLLTPSDWNRWATGSLLTHHFQRNDPSEPQNLASNFLGGPNVQFGAGRFRVLRVQRFSCSLDSKWLPQNGTLFPQECFAPYSSSGVNSSAFGPPTAPTAFPYSSGCYYGYIVGDMGTYDCSGNYFDLVLNQSRNDAAQALNLLVPTSDFQGFFDPSSARFVSYAFFVYNPPTDYFALITLWQEYSPTGAFVPGWRSVPFRLYTDQYKSTATLTVIFAIMVLFHLIGYFVSIVDAACRGKLLDRLLNVWMLLDVINIISFAVLFGFRFVWWSKSSSLKYRLSTSEGYNEDLQYLSTLYDAQTFSLTVSTLLVFLRILKFNTLSSRLGVINRTLDNATQNLVNLLVIFAVVVLSYAVMATALFGSSLKAFFSYEVAISSLLRMLIGDFDYDGLKQEQWYLAALFFWSYMILGLFLLLNMMIAVIGDAFENEHNNAPGAPISDEIAEFFKGAFRSVVRFFANPSGAIGDAVSVSKRKFSQHGKFSIISSQTRAFRFSLPCEHVSAEQFSVLSDEDKEAVLPNPKINRYELEKVFDVDESTREMLIYLGAAFLDDFWLEVVAEYRFFRDEHLHQKIAKRKARIKVAGSQALRAVLSEPLPDSTDCRASEVFALPHESLKALRAISINLDQVERAARLMGDTAARVNAAQLKVNFGLQSQASPSSARSQVTAGNAVAGYKRFLRTTNSRVPEVG